MALLVVAAVLVYGIGTLLGGLGSDDPADTATPASSSTSSGETSSETSRTPLGPTVPQKVRTPKATAALLPPTGDCDADQVSVVPSVPVAAAGQPITLRLSLEGTQPACTFAVSPGSLVVKITSGADRIWSSQDCQGSIRKQDVVVRSAVPADVPVIWSGRRSDDDCSNSTAWVLPGFYHVYAAALGSAATDVQFEVTYPKRSVVTKTAKPKPSKKPGATASSTASPTASPTAKTTAEPKKKKRKDGGSVCGGDNAAGSC